MARRRVTYPTAEGMKEAEGEEIGFRIVEDAYVVVQVEDGAVIRLKNVVINVIKTEARDENGKRLYVLDAVTHIAVDKRADGEDADAAESVPQVAKDAG